jgi:hypothetical protein
VGLLSTSYSGIISASVNGGTNVEVAEDGLVLLGPTVNTLSISAYPFEPGGDWFLGVRCPSSAPRAEETYVGTVDFGDRFGGSGVDGVEGDLKN